MRYVMLSQDNCQKCETLKLMLTKPMKGEFDSVIKKVHRQENPEEFLQYVKEYGVSGTPVIIDTESKEVMRDFSSGPRIKKFLKGEGI